MSDLVENPEDRFSHDAAHFQMQMFWDKNVYSPISPNFTTLKWGVRGSTLHGHVNMIIGLNGNMSTILYIYFSGLLVY